MLRRGGRRRGLSDFALGGALGCLFRYWPRKSGCGHGGGPAEETARHSGPRAYRRAEAQAPLVFVARGGLKWVRPRLRCNQRTACASKTLWHAAASGVLTIVAAPLPRIQLATGVPVTVPVVEDKDEAAFFVVGAKKSEWNKLHKLKSKGKFSYQFLSYWPRNRVE